MKKIIDDLLNNDLSLVYFKFKKIKRLCILLNICNLSILMYIILGSFFFPYSGNQGAFAVFNIVIKFFTIFLIFIMNQIQDQLKILNKRIIKILDGYVSIVDRIGEEYGLDKEKFNKMSRYKKYKYAEEFCLRHRLLKEED